MRSNSRVLQGNHPTGMRRTTSSPKASQPYQPFQAGRCFHVAVMSLAGCLPAHSLAQVAAEQGEEEEEEGDQSLRSSELLKAPCQVTVV